MNALVDTLASIIGCSAIALVIVGAGIVFEIRELRSSVDRLADRTGKV